MSGEWIRDDLPSPKSVERSAEDNYVWITSYDAEFVLGVVVDHLNANHPKSGTDRWRRAHEIVERERDLAREQWKKWEHKANEADREVSTWRTSTESAHSDFLQAAHDRDEWQNRAEVAEGAVDSLERDRDEWRSRAEAAEKRHTWPKITPTGHTYIAPDTYQELCHQHSNAAQAEVECWEADECPPEPTWEMVGIAHREVERIQRDLEGMKRDYCECQEELVEASLERDQWMARAEAAEARTAPAVTKADIEQAVAEWVDDAPEIVNEVWSLVSGDDPAVFAVRESDIAAVEVEQDEEGGWQANGDLVAMRQNTAEALRGWSLGDLQMLARYEAVARAIEAKVDPIMARARELLDLAYPGDYAFTGAFETCRRIAEAEARLEAGDE